ncbi:MAG TPA: hypothetical protein DC058_16545 [Planctomycetaceae bacterium]|nr:hypothetical protein [Planctomycetaceae bacterium]
MPKKSIREGRNGLEVPLSAGGPPEKGDSALIFPKLVPCLEDLTFFSVGKNRRCGNRHVPEVCKKAGKLHLRGVLGGDWRSWWDFAAGWYSKNLCPLFLAACPQWIVVVGWTILGVRQM